MTIYNTHNTTEAAKVTELAASMEVNGWQGAPLIRWGDVDLITGSHRFAAAQMAGIEAPTVELEDVFAEDGKDFAELHAEYDYPTYTDPSLVYLLGELSEEIREKYGIDWN